MGILPSHPTHLYLPADALRLCSPHACFCRGPRHSRNKVVYVERSPASGREYYRDLMDLFDARGGGGGGGELGSWRQRDVDMVNRVLTQLLTNQRGGGEGGMTMGMGGQGWAPQGYYPNPYSPPAQSPWGSWQGPWQGGGGHEMGDGGGGRGGGGRREVPDDDLREKVRILHDIAFGSEADKQEKQLQEQMLKRLQPMIPELAKLIALQQADLNGSGAGANAGAGMMAGAMPSTSGMAAGVMPSGSMGATYPYAAAAGMSNTYPYAAAADTSGMYPTMGGGGYPSMPGGGSRRRGRPRRATRDFDDDDDNDDDDDFGGFGRKRAGGRGAGRRQRRPRFNFDDEDLFGDRGGDDLRWPRGPPPRGPQRPRPSNGGGGGSMNGGGGVAFDTLNNDVRFRSVPVGDPQPAQWTSPPRATAQPPMATAPPPDRILTPIPEPANLSPPPIPIEHRQPPPGAIPISPEGVPPYRFYDTTRPPTYPGIPVSDFPPTRPTPIRRPHFQEEAGLARPRQDEENRGEPPAGGPANARDATPL